MPNTFNQLDTFHRTRTGHIVFGAVEFVLMCLLGLWALDNGSLWLWGSVAILLFGTVQNAYHAVRVNKK